MGLRNSWTSLEPPDLMDRLEPPDLHEQVLLHEESASWGLGSDRSAPSVPGGAQSAWARFTARLHHQAHGSTQIWIQANWAVKMLRWRQAIDPVVFTQIRLDSQLIFNGSDLDLWRCGPVEDATLLMVKTHGSTPPQIRIRAIEKLIHFDRIWAVKYSHG